MIYCRNVAKSLNESLVLGHREMAINDAMMAINDARMAINDTRMAINDAGMAIMFMFLYILRELIEIFGILWSIMFATV